MHRNKTLWRANVKKAPKYQLLLETTQSPSPLSLPIYYLACTPSLPLCGDPRDEFKSLSFRYLIPTTDCKCSYSLYQMYNIHVFLQELEPPSSWPENPTSVPAGPLRARDMGAGVVRQPHWSARWQATATRGRSSASICSTKREAPYIDRELAVNSITTMNHRQFQGTFLSPSWSRPRLPPSGPSKDTNFLSTP